MEIYHYTDNFWHEYYNVTKVKRRKQAICKHCNQSILIKEIAAIVNYKYGHILPNDDGTNSFDWHYDGIIAILHTMCITKFIKINKKL